MLLDRGLLALLAGVGLTLGLSSGPTGASVSVATAPDDADRRGPAALTGPAPPSGVDVRPERSGAGWAWPLDPAPTVVHPFDPPRRRWEPGHRGVDLAASVGQQVRAPEAGEVTFAADLAGRGVVVVRHRNGLRSTFEPVAGAVRVGTPVSRGEVVGHVTPGPTHCAPQTCLHWGVLRGQDYLDPLALLGRARIVLLPLG
ncbi:M23 family metallopeptidase [Intrasporangium sp.]|uniref:M23 family metallopeptidase n=1 Tax=Intrasporangium sp. TaxID=1925024 RepID=UPI00293B2AD1|nr:M23 family metallopeptidase [Intrasporangium sp.]MDV3221642.1 M23 family metallopeptidase [Intrasporangium sp.]